MKALLLLAFVAASQPIFGQRGGYEVLQIGKNFYDKDIADDYNVGFSSSDSVVFRLQSKLPKFVCGNHARFSHFPGE